MANERSVFEHFLLGRILLGIQRAADCVFAHVGGLDLAGDGRCQGIHLAAKGIQITGIHRVVQRGVGTWVGRQRLVLSLGLAMVVEAGLGLQVQAVDGHSGVAGLDAHLLGAKTGLRQLIVTLDGTGIADQHHVACAELAPVDLVDGVHYSGIGIFVEAAAGDLGLFQIGDLGQKVGTVLHAVGVGVHLADVLQSWHRVGAGAEGN